MISINKNSEIINIIFIDISKSTLNWYNYDKKMIIILEKFAELVKNISIKYNSVLMLPTGDGFKILTNTLSDAILLSIELQKELKNNPIKIVNSNLQVKIGICQGPAYKNIITIQNAKIKDYVGNIINIASRLESVVCSPGDICFFVQNNNINLNNILQNYSVNLILFGIKRKNIDIDNLVTKVKKIKQYSNKALKGINKLKVYSITNI